ncbi:MAG: DNA mismatch repair endonuclease MutL [Eubacterium sp.]|nr:DNA mismatch repair endonuclease MutL [Eubacterium sp.]
MRTIEVLDKTTIDKIAAGEVVERPASVVKELTENAIDAGATAVTIEIRDGGISLIRITDNGAGIPADQVQKAFLRHATSKIRKAEDLVQIASLGFRGEALSSISAVAKVECITKTPEALTGTRYCIEGGVEKEIEEIGAPGGTTFLVRNLFYNVPARAKFLKSASAEGNRVSSFVEELALSHPEISFKYIMNGQNRLYTSGNGNLKDIVYQIYGRDITKELLEIKAESPLMKVTGFIGKPNVARGSRAFENYFVNGRFVKDKVIAKAIEDAYHGFLMQHRYPFTLMYLEIDGEKVDVNVHPSKMEIRLSDQETIYHEICLAIQNTLMRSERIPEVGLENRTGNAEKREVPPRLGNRPEPFERVMRTENARIAETDLPRPDAPHFAGPVRQPSWTNAAPKPSTYVPDASFEKNLSWSASLPKSPVTNVPVTDEPRSEEPLRSTHVMSGSENEDASAQDADITVSEEAASYGAELPSPEQLSFLTEDKVMSEQARRMFRIIGQIFETYWLIEYKDSLYIVDQHAAHEKVNYERMMKNYREKKINSQMIYPAIIVNLSRQEADLLENNKDVFAELGYEIENFGGRSYKISAVPANLYGVATDKLFVQIMDQLTDLGEIKPAMIPEMLASMSCKAAVKGNNKMSVQEAEALIDELLTLENPYNCPHGRPTIVSMTRYELDKKFRRIV